MASLIRTIPDGLARRATNMGQTRAVVSLSVAMAGGGIMRTGICAPRSCPLLVI